MRLNVFREWDQTYELVGSIGFEEDSLSFSYASDYLTSSRNCAISLSLPLREEPFGEREASPFFAGLAPEGDMRRLVAEAIHSESPGQILARLNNESIGSLVFSTGERIERQGEYSEVSLDELIQLRDEPKKVSFDMGMASRLSLAGAQSKVGLYHAGNDPTTGWFAPSETNPTTHIVKTPDAAFPDQTVNEALCLETARRCGFDVADWSLIPLPGGEPLLAVRRFDRVIDEAEADGHRLALPRRLHQEDFCQATALMPDMKYEPTGGNYLARCCSAISRASRDPFGDRAYLLQSLFFDYLIGNCDNHLKNRSIIWDASWRTRSLSPLYDITCTTIYPNIYLEMGMALCPSRRISDVVEDDINNAIQSVGIPLQMGRDFYRDLHREFLPALEGARCAIMEQGFASAARVAEHIASEFQEKVLL